MNARNGPVPEGQPNDASLGALAALVTRGAPLIDHAQAISVVRDVINASQSIGALAPALAKLSTTATPATARALQATENVWRGIEEEYGLLGSADVARLLSAKSDNRSYASVQRSTGKIIGVRRLNKFVYPGFQFDGATKRVKPVIPLLIDLAHEVGWSEDELVLWLCSPSGYFRGDAPVEHLADVDELLSRAREAATVEW